MPKRNIKKPPIMLKKIRVRGDEVAAVFFGIIVTVLLVCSSLRFLPIGKILDDFVFTLWFGWTKYLVYLVILIFLVPIFFNYYFKIRFRFFCLIFISFFVISWTLQTIVLAITQPNIWFNFQALKLHYLIKYCHNWWNTTVIQQYHGFFNQPIMFNEWNLNGIFPPALVGGIVSNALIAILSYGYFIFNVIANSLIIILLICCALKRNPLSIFFRSRPLPVKPIKKPFKKQKIRETLDYDEQPIATEIINPIPSDSELIFKNPTQLLTTTITQHRQNDDVMPQEQRHSNAKPNKNHHFTSSGHLTPFGYLKPDAVEKSWEINQTIDFVNNMMIQDDEPATFTLFDDKVKESTDATKQLKTTLKQKLKLDNYQLPILAKPSISADLSKMQAENVAYAKVNREKIDRLFQEFKIAGKVINYKIGTTVTKYEIAIVSGMRVNKITGLEDELKLALANHNIRIEAPIPKKSMIGIEVANPEIVPVSLYEQMLHIKHYQSKGALLISIGKDTAGDYIFHSLASMPHLLISGSTGSGKSAFINNLLVSLLLQYSPQTLKLLLIDPKWVELINYNGLPHLLSPVISNLEHVPNALQKIITEMMARYQLLAAANCRNIETYNAKMTDKLQCLPYYVIIIDELADLMLQNSNLIEDKIQRITQMGRAAGIHLIVATQRPSIDVITGVIKNNIPSRIAFKVASWIDSKTIIDIAGAEKLLGKGDLLFLAPGINGPIRIQAPWIDDEAVAKVVTFIKKQYK